MLLRAWPASVLSHSILAGWNTADWWVFNVDYFACALIAANLSILTELILRRLYFFTIHCVCVCVAHVSSRLFLSMIFLIPPSDRIVRLLLLRKKQARSTWILNTILHSWPQFPFTFLEIFEKFQPDTPSVRDMEPSRNKRCDGKSISDTNTLQRGL